MQQKTFFNISRRKVPHCPCLGTPVDVRSAVYNEYKLYRLERIFIPTAIWLIPALVWRGFNRKPFIRSSESWPAV